MARDSRQPPDLLQLLQLLTEVVSTPDIPFALRARFAVLAAYAVRTGDVKPALEFLETSRIAQYLARTRLLAALTKQLTGCDPPPVDVSGPIAFGTTQDGKLVGSDRERLPHIDLCGMTGSGKTSGARHICARAIEQNIVVWAFDLKWGVDYADFGPQNGFLVLPLSRVPLALLSVNFSDFFRVIFRSVFFLQSADYVMADAVRTTRAKNPSAGLHDLFQYLRDVYTKLTPNERRLAEQILPRLHQLLQATGDAYHYSEGVCIEKLARTNCVFVADVDDPYIVSFCTYSLIASLIEYRRRTDQFGDRCDHLVIVEEAARLIGMSVRDERNVQFDTDVLGPIVAVARELMVRFVFSSSAPLNSSIPRACGIKLYLRQSEPEDVERCAHTLGLDRTARDYYANKCPRGVGLCKYPHDDWNGVFVVELPAPLPKERLSRAELEREYARSLAAVTPPRPRKVTITHENGLDANEAALLVATYELPFLPSGEQAQRAVLTEKPATVRSRLVTKGLVQEARVRGIRNNSVFFEILPAGLKALGRPSPYGGKGASFQHAYWANAITTAMKAKGFRVRAEVGCDLLAERDDPKGRLAIEVTLHIENVARNAARNREQLGLGTTFLVPTKPEVEAVKSRLEGIEGAEVITFLEFLDRLGARR
jgi:hypothetical protein